MIFSYAKEIEAERLKSKNPGTPSNAHDLANVWTLTETFLI